MTAVVSGDSDVLINHLVSASKQIKCEKQVVISLFTRSQSADMWYGTCDNSTFECVKRGWEFVYGVCVCVFGMRSVYETHAEHHISSLILWYLSHLQNKGCGFYQQCRVHLKQFKQMKSHFSFLFFMPWLTHNPSIYILIWGTLVNYCSWVVMTNSTFA